MVALTDRLLMSYDEYLAWEATQEIRHEYINGEAILWLAVSANIIE